jgi:hypothetical protein
MEISIKASALLQPESFNNITYEVRVTDQVQEGETDYAARARTRRKLLGGGLWLTDEKLRGRGPGRVSLVCNIYRIGL